MKRILPLLFFVSLFYSNAFGQLNMVLSSQVPYQERLNDVWGWANPADNREYALVGVRNGLSIIDVTDPANPVDKGFIAGPISTWRDIKTWNNYAFCVNDSPDSGPSDGILIVDLSNLPNPITASDYYYWKPTYQRGSQTETVTHCHNIYIDEFGIAYLAGCDGNNGGMIMIDVDDGANPVVEGLAPAIYAHDVYTRGNKMYSSEIYEGRMAIYDVSDKNNIQRLGQQFTPFRFTHNIWLSDNGNVAYTTDERGNAPVAAYDVSDPTDIIELDQFKPLLTEGTGVIPHNVHVWNDWLIISYYTDGCIIVDASRPNNLIEVGNFDTFFGGSGGNGVWGAYPFLPSGTILGTDINTGLYILEPTYVRACHLEGNVIDTIRQVPISGVDVSISTTELHEGTTGILGDYATGLVTPGKYDVTYSKAGYRTKTVELDFQSGQLLVQDIELKPLGNTFNLSGEILKNGNGNPVPNAQVVLKSANFTYSFMSDSRGKFQSDGIVAGTYDIYASTWGYQTAYLSAQLNENSPSFTISLTEGYQDEFVLDKGWTVVSDATTGIWVRDDPIGTFSDQTPINPEDDNSGDLGAECFVTGNGGGNIGTDDVDNGATTLISPAMDLTRYSNPTLTFDYWFANVDRNPAANDSFRVSVTNGLTEVILLEVTNSTNQWVTSPEFGLSAYLPITDNMQIKFRAVDADPGHVTEAGVDVFKITSETALPIELTTFHGTVKENGNLLNWTTASEFNHDYFVLERSLNGYQFEAIADIQGQRNSQVTNHYHFLDKDSPKGSVYYRLKSVDLEKNYEYSSIVVLNRSTIKDDFAIQLYPNPFRSSTNISYEWPKDNHSAVRLRLYDVLGNELQSVALDRSKESLEIGNDLSKGVYLVKFEIDNNLSQVFKLIKQ